MNDGIADRRSRRTRDAILRAFVTLVFDRRYDLIRVGDLIALSGVGRSTFYEHFRGKDDVLLTAMEPVLQPLAAAATRRASTAQLRAMLEHVWSQRGVGRRILSSSSTLVRLQRQLAAMIAPRLDPESPGAPLAAAAAAAAQLAMLRTWLSGEVSCAPAVLARRMLACGRLTS